MAPTRGPQDREPPARPPWNSSSRAAERTRRLSASQVPGPAGDGGTPPPTQGHRSAGPTPDKVDRQAPFASAAWDCGWAPGPPPPLRTAQHPPAWPGHHDAGRPDPAAAAAAPEAPPAASRERRAGGEPQSAVAIQRWWRECAAGARAGAGGGPAGAAEVGAGALARRPYCPGQYEDAGQADRAAPPAPLGVDVSAAATLGGSPRQASELPGASELAPLEEAALDRAARLRSQVRSLQGLRARAGHGASPEPAPPRAAAAAAWTAGPEGGRPTCSPTAPAAAAAPRPHLAARPAAPPRPPQPNDRLSSILNFLDEVEESSRADISSLVSSARSTRAPAEEAPGRLGGDGEAAGARKGVASAVSERRPGPGGGGLAHDVAALYSRVSTLEVEVQDKRSIIERLRQALAASQERERALVQEVAKEWDEKLQKAKAHHESSLERHLKLADQLLNDKTELTRRCELFTEELKAVERKFQTKTEEMDQQHSKDLARQKQNWVAAERLRREAWERDKTREIKEMTIKGLEPEVERILAERKQERRLLEEKHRDELEAQRLELLQQAQAQLQEARQRQLQEQERLLDQERDAHRRKLREELDRFGADVLAERSRCAADVLAEQRRREQELQQCAEACDARLQKALAAERARAQAADEERQAAAAAADERHRAEVAQLQERFRAQQLQLEEDGRERARAELEQREAALREELTAERDQQLDELMERLSREHVEQQRALKDEVAAAAERARSDAGEEARRLGAELAEAHARGAALEAQQRLLEETAQSLRDRREADVARLHDLGERVRGLEAENAALRHDADEASRRHQAELSAAGSAGDQEAEALRKENARLAACVEQERARGEQLAAEARQHEEQVVGSLEVRVRRTLQAKEEAAGELRSRCSAAENRARELEFLLARQREELLDGITQVAPRPRS